MVLDSITFQDDYEGNFETRRALIYTLNFTAKTYMFGPIADSTDGLIRKVQVDYYSDTNVKTAKRMQRYTVEATAKKDYNEDDVIDQYDNPLIPAGDDLDLLRKEHSLAILKITAQLEKRIFDGK